MIDKALDHIFETPNAVMRTLASPSLGAADLAVWTVEMRAGQAGPLHRAEDDPDLLVLCAVERAGPPRAHLDGPDGEFR